jgi:hypothetical protein
MNKSVTHPRTRVGWEGGDLLFEEPKNMPMGVRARAQCGVCALLEGNFTDRTRLRNGTSYEYVKTHPSLDKSTNAEQR